MNLWELGENTYSNNPEIELLKDEGCRVVGIEQLPNGDIRFNELCDQHFSVTYSKTKAIEALLEAISWINQPGDTL